jgi:hypothetical protein
MQIPTEHLELVRDALYTRSMTYTGCFGFNKSSERVQEIGLPILPALEHVIREEVMANCPLDPKAQLETFPGIGNLLVDYLRIARKEGQLDRAAKFISGLHGAVLVEAIRHISIGWNHVIPEPFLKIIEMTSINGSVEEREIARWALDWHHNKRQEEKESVEV